MNEKNINKRKLNPKKVGAFIACIVLFIIFLIAKGAKSPKISIKGNSNVEIDLNSNYSDEGATAKYGSKNITKSIQTANGVDTSKVGTYYVTYSVKYKKKSVSATRTVKVIDSIVPELTLVGDAEINIEQDSKYKELGCIAKDNYDGDISSKITIDNSVDTSNLGSYTVTYNVSDSSGNKASITRTVNVVKKGAGNISTAKNSGLPVLMYHYFYDSENGGSGKDANYIDIRDFENQLKYLTDNGYYFPTWDEVANFVNGKSCLPEHSVVITVDDGDESFFNLAVPVIEKYNVKVTAFVVTSWLEDSNYLKQFNKEKIIFASHSNDMHKSGSNGNGAFLTMSHDDALADVKESKKIIGDTTVFSYPFGDYSDACEKILQEAGFELAFTKNYSRVRPGDNAYALGRIKISKGETLDTFIQRVS